MIAIAFLIRGASRVYSDFAAHPADKPAYTRSPTVALVVAAILMWWQRQSPIQLILNFAWTFGFVWLLCWLLGLAITSAGVRFAILLTIPAVILLAAFQVRPRRAQRKRTAASVEAVKLRILEDLQSIARGKKDRFDPDAIQAVKALGGLQRANPETVAAWATVLDDLQRGKIDAMAMRRRLNELLYPDTLEDMDALKRQVTTNLNEVARARDGRRISSEAREAAKVLNEINRQHAAIRQKERESEVLAKNEEARAAARIVLQKEGLPETAFDGLTLEELFTQVRLLRTLCKHEDVAERRLFLRQFLVDLTAAKEGHSKVGSQRETTATTDVLFIPELPIAFTYEVVGLTEAGIAFVDRNFPNERSVKTGAAYEKLKQQIADEGLTFKEDWSGVVRIIE